MRFEYNRSFGHGRVLHPVSWEHFKDQLRTYSFFPKYNFRDGVISGIDYEGQKHVLGKLFQDD